MASAGSLESLLGPLPEDLKKVMVSYTREWAKRLRFGAISEAREGAACENFGGRLVPYTTSSVANREVAVAHGLGRTPRWLMPGLPANVVNATAPVITISRAADMRYFYVKSATASATGWMYVE